MTLLKTGLRYLLRRPLQSILCILGVALGVAMVIAIDLANGSAARAFELSTETVAGRATHQIVGSGAGLDEAVYRRLKVELGVREAAPVVESYAIAVELDQQPLRILGVDAFAEAPFRSYLGQGNAPLRQNDLTDFFVRPDALLIGQETAARYGLRLGDALTLRAGDARRTMRIAGILNPADERSRRALDGLAIVDISTAQELFNMAGRLSHIDLIADERTEAGRALLDRIRAVLPPGAAIVKPSARSQSVESLTDAFRLNLTALSLLALVVGMFLIYNTITFSVVQRRPIIGTLRCLGVTQAEVFRQVLLETLLLGAIGGVLGIGLGILLGRGAVGLVSQTINDLYYTVNVRSVDVDPWTLAKGFGLGLAASLLAALAPAYEATSIPPITALRRSAGEQRVRWLLPRVALAGLVMLAIGAAMLLLSRALVVNLGGIFFVLIGLALASPMATIGLMGALQPLLDRLAGLVGRLSARGVVNAISRTAIAIASLMVAVSVIIGLQSMINSFRTTVESWLDASLTADVYIAPPATGINASNATIAPSVVADFEALPDVSDVTLFRRVSVDFRTADAEYRPASLLAIRSNRERSARTFVWTLRPADGLWASMAGQDEVQVSEPFANKYGITPQNNRLLLRTDQGERAFRVVAVYYDYASDAGVIVMRHETYRRYWEDAQISSLALYVNPARVSDLGAFVDQLRRRFAGRDLVISANRELRADALAIFERTFTITGALNLLATVVAFIGVLSALMALQIERTRELGMLRANGMTLRQLWRMTLLETGLMGGTAGLLAMPTGFLLALILVYIINLRSFGWTIRLD
ncbi:MAG: ABC transporter permease, partial [Chloroflexi bacterium]|nr:ABC transporter permease [Chloroflexota bacterium]